MPKRRVEQERNPNWRYGSVTITKEMMYFIDQVLDQSASYPAISSDSFNADGTKIPSRRQLLQDSIDLYLYLIFPHLRSDFIQLLEDEEKYTPFDCSVDFIRNYEQLLSENKDLRSKLDKVIQRRVGAHNSSELEVSLS
jgi:hypothetical protein